MLVAPCRKKDAVFFLVAACVLLTGCASVRTHSDSEWATTPTITSSSPRDVEGERSVFLLQVVSEILAKLFGG